MYNPMFDMLTNLSNLNKYRTDNGLLLKISKHLLEYVTGIPDFKDLP